MGQEIGTQVREGGEWLLIRSRKNGSEDGEEVIGEEENILDMGSSALSTVHRVPCTVLGTS